MRTSMLLFTASLVAAAACKGQVVGTNSTGTGSGGQGSGGGPIVGMLVSACPASAPAVGTSCTDTGLECEYGNDLDWTCNVVVHCKVGNTWEMVSGGNPMCPSHPFGIGPGCPSSHAAASMGDVCTQNEQVCGYPEGICVCQPGFVIGPGSPDAAVPPSTWQCAMPSTGCPPFPSRPRLGSPCSNSALSCDYGVCGVPTNTAYTCDTSGYWIDSFGQQCGGA
jgi:hypothetical protein